MFKYILIICLLIIVTQSACPATCQACNEQDICAQCATADKTPSSNCQCSEEQFWDGAACTACGDLCASCIEAATCTSCKDGPGLALNLESNLCECMEDYIDQGDAAPFGSKCKECYIYGNECVPECPPETTQNDDVKICEIGKAEDVENDDQTHIIIVAIIIIVVQLLLSIALYNYLFSKLKEAFTKDQNAIYELSAEERAYLAQQGGASLDQDEKKPQNKEGSVSQSELAE